MACPSSSKSKFNLLLWAHSSTCSIMVLLGKVMPVVMRNMVIVTWDYNFDLEIYKDIYLDMRKILIS